MSFNAKFYFEGERYLAVHENIKLKFTKVILLLTVGLPWFFILESKHNTIIFILRAYMAFWKVEKSSTCDPKTRNPNWA